MWCLSTLTDAAKLFDIRHLRGLPDRFNARPAEQLEDNSFREANFLWIRRNQSDLDQY
jgi:hypothetical protein